MKAAVIGMGCVSALGHTVQETMDNFLAGITNSQPPSRLRPNPTKTYPVLEVSSHKEISDQQGDKLRTSQFLELALNEALNDASRDMEGIASNRIGTVFGTTVGCAMNNEDFYREYLKDAHPSMDAITRFLTNNPSLYIRDRFKYKGISQTINNACASGTDAIGQALSWLNAGLCDVVIAGGTDELVSVVYNGFIALQVYSEASPKPFSGNRDGLNLGEGAGVMILTRPELASNPLGYILSYGSASDSYHPTAPHPEGKGLIAAIDEAMQIADSTAEELSFINAHGTATNDNDKVEGYVFKHKLPQVPFFSPKAQTGHTLGAAGAIEAIITLDLLNRKLVPKSIGFEVEDEAIKHIPTLEISVSTKKKAISTSLAFGGTNSAIVIEGRS